MPGGLRSGLTGPLSRRNTASHRFCLPGPGRCPSARRGPAGPAPFPSPFQRIHTKQGERPCVPLWKKLTSASYGGMIRIRCRAPLAHPLPGGRSGPLGSELLDSLSARCTGSPAFLWLHYTASCRKMQAPVPTSWPPRPWGRAGCGACCLPQRQCKGRARPRPGQSPGTPALCRTSSKAHVS